MALLDCCTGRSLVYRTMDRRKLILWGGVGTVVVIVLIVIIVVATQSSSSSPSKGSDALKNTPLIDGHNDLPNNLRLLLKNKLANFKFEEDLTNDTIWGKTSCKECFTDLPRLKKGRVGAQFWVAYVGCESQYRDAVSQTFEQIDVIRRLVKKYPDDLEFVTTADGIEEAFDDNKIASLIGVEGGHSIDSRLGVLRTMYDLGVRYMTLTHACNTPWADASPATGEPVNKLTDFGKNIVREMNRLGMMVDISHVSEEVMVDVLATTKAPVIFSHSSSWAVYNHHRNVKDHVLLKLKDNKGIIMVNFYTGFLAPPNTTVNIATVMNHINHIVDVTGVDHVGIGGDYDGVNSVPIGLEDVSKYPMLFDALHLNKPERWTIDNLEKLAGKNLLRVFRAVEKIRDDSKDTPVEDWISRDALKIIPENVTICRSLEDVNNPE